MTVAGKYDMKTSWKLQEFGACLYQIHCCIKSLRFWCWYFVYDLFSILLSRAAISCWRPYLVFLSGFLGDSMLLGTRKISRSSCTLCRVLSLLIGLMISSCITGRDVWSMQTVLFVTETGAGRRLIFEARSLTDCCNRRQTVAAHLVPVFGVF